MPLNPKCVLPFGLQERRHYLVVQYYQTLVWVWLDYFSHVGWARFYAHADSDHLHYVWTLPDGDADFSTRWMMIKRAVSLACREDYRRADWVTASKLKHRESTIWQRRFWEHQIRDENDFVRHVDYIHFNPVKHGHGQHAID